MSKAAIRLGITGSILFIALFLVAMPFAGFSSSIYPLIIGVLGLLAALSTKEWLFWGSVGQLIIGFYMTAFNLFAYVGRLGIVYKEIPFWIEIHGLGCLIAGILLLLGGFIGVISSFRNWLSS